MARLHTKGSEDDARLARALPLNLLTTNLSIPTFSELPVCYHSDEMDFRATCVIVLRTCLSALDLRR